MFSTNQIYNYRKIKNNYCQQFSIENNYKIYLNDIKFEIDF